MASEDVPMVRITTAARIVGVHCGAILAAIRRGELRGEDRVVWQPPHTEAVRKRWYVSIHDAVSLSRTRVA